MAPYASDAQRRFFHTPTAKKQGISEATVKEFDQASKGMKLPEQVKKKKDPAPTDLSAQSKSHFRR